MVYTSPYGRKAKPVTEPGWVYILTNPTWPGCVKIGGSSRTVADRQRELVSAYNARHPFTKVDEIAVADWRGVEAAAHRMLADCRRDRSELFECSERKAISVVKRCARAFDRPGPLRRLFVPGGAYLAPVGRKKGRGGSNWVPALLGLGAITAALVVVKPEPPKWLPGSMRHTVEIIETHG